MSIQLTVVQKAAARDIAYPQILFTFTSGKIVCPNLWEFTINRTNMELQWYKVEFSISPYAKCKMLSHL